MILGRVKLFAHFLCIGKNLNFQCHNITTMYENLFDLFIFEYETTKKCDNFLNHFLYTSNNFCYPCHIGILSRDLIHKICLFLNVKSISNFANCSRKYFKIIGPKNKFFWIKKTQFDIGKRLILSQENKQVYTKRHYLAIIHARADEALRSLLKTEDMEEINFMIDMCSLSAESIQFILRWSIENNRMMESLYFDPKLLLDGLYYSLSRNNKFMVKNILKFTKHKTHLVNMEDVYDALFGDKHNTIMEDVYDALFGDKHNTISHSWLVKHSIAKRTLFTKSLEWGKIDIVRSMIKGTEFFPFLTEKNINSAVKNLKSVKYLVNTDEKPWWVRTHIFKRALYVGKNDVILWLLDNVNSEYDFQCYLDAILQYGDAQNGLLEKLIWNYPKKSQKLDFSKEMKFAAQKGYLQMLKTFLNTGADIHNEYNLVLRTALCYDQKKVVEFLLKNYVFY